MSVYKVPQDVEADDKLLGPFSFRQFIYLLVVAGCIGICIFLWQIFPGLIIIPAPIIIFFGALALPLRKDQPMETYLAAVVSFYLKPNKRFWQPDGIEHLIQISAPLNKEEKLTKDISQSEASRRLSYLADIVDTEGWAIKNAVAPLNNAIREEYVHEAHSAEDMFDNSRISNNVNNLLSQNDQRRKQQIMQNMNIARNLAQYTDYNSEEIQSQAYYFDPKNKYIGSDNVKIEEVQAGTPQIQPTGFSNAQQAQYQMNFSQNSQPQNGWQNPPVSNTQNEDFENIQLHYNPYPESINQSVISPNWQNQQTQPQVQSQQISNPLQQQIQQNYQPQAQTSENLDALSQDIERLRQLNQAIVETPKDPTARISTNPQDNPFVNKKKEIQQNFSKEISEEMKRLVSEGKDLSVETLARQANKISEKKKIEEEIDLNEEEVLISLR